MKQKILLFPTIMLLSVNFALTKIVAAQTSQLWSMTQYGGANGYGAIFKINKDGTGYDTAYSFSGTGGYPWGSLMQASNGRLYGMTLVGGANGFGNIFSFNPDDSSYTDLVDFDNTNGAYPFGSLIQVGDSLYGMTNYGGANEAGVLFSFSILTNAYIKLVDFDNADGAGPYGSLTEMGGLLYGMTEQGGANGYGVIFSYTLATGPSSYSDLYDFKNDDSPLGNLTQVGDSLYGMSSSGGTYYQGNIFSFNPATGNYTDLYDFSNAEIPTGNLILEGGLLYGMAPAGGAYGLGYIFSFDPGALLFNDLQDFTDALPDYGASPFGSLMEASNGIMYGMTYFGGAYGEGTIFSFDPSNPTIPPVDLRDLNNDGATFFDGIYPTYSSFIEVACNAPAASASSNSPVCSGSTLNLSAGGGASYAWSGPDGFSSSLQNPFISNVTLAAAGSYIVTIANATGCTATASASVTINNCSATLNLKMFIQGYYRNTGSTTPMDNYGAGGCLYLSGVSSNPTEVDTVTISLEDPNTQSQVGASVKGILHTDGSIWQNGNPGVTFPGSVIGNSYYIKITHRNAIETWSGSAVPFTSNTVYDFSSGNDQSYGDNMVLADNINGQDIYAFWNGDVYDANNNIPYAQDGVIESADYGLIEEDYTTILFGYYPTDVTGDGVVESADYSLIEENYTIIIFASTPW